MSINKNYSEGSKGGDFNYRLRILQGLQEAINNTGSLDGLLPLIKNVSLESTQQQVLNTLINLLAENKLDFEMKSVKDANGNVFQLRGTLNEETGVFTWDYIDASGSVAVPVAPVVFLNPDGLLTAIEAELIDIGITLGDIYSTIHVEEDDNAIPENLTLPTSIVELYGNWDGAWQRIVTDGNGNLSVTVSNLTGLNLEATQLLVKAVLDTIKTDTALINSNVVLGNITLNAIDTVLDAIKLDTANLDVALSTRATEATLLLVKGVLDAIKLDTAAINTNTDGIEALLTTIDAVLDAIKLDTANLDVALSTRATEATLVTVNNTLGFIFGQLQTIDNNISTRASEATLVVADQKLGLLTVDKTPTSIASTGVTNIPAFATEISVFNNGTGDATVNGVKCPPGVTRTFGFKNPTSAIIVCDGGGTEELIIDYMA